jgi:hypothetical protein
VESREECVGDNSENERVGGGKYLNKKGAVLRVLEKEGGLALADKAQFVAGHSLGEYTALCAAGSFSLADTARLLRLRGQSMQAAVPVSEGAMCALLGAEIDQVNAIVDHGHGMRDGRIGVRPATAIRKGIWGEIEHPHDQRALEPQLEAPAVKPG